MAPGVARDRRVDRLRAGPWPDCGVRVLDSPSRPANSISRGRLLSDYACRCGRAGVAAIPSSIVRRERTAAKSLAHRTDIRISGPARNLSRSALARTAVVYAKVHVPVPRNNTDAADRANVE